MADHATTTCEAAPGELDALFALDVASMDADGCAVVLGRVQAVRGRLASFEASVSARIEALHAAGEGSPAAETHARSQRVSSAQARRRERRGRVLRDLPSLAAALEDGSITTDHVDAYASATMKASDAAKERLAGRVASVLSQARRVGPDAFGRYCARQVREAERNDGLDRDQQQRNDTRLRSWINAETGLRHIGGAFHPELGSRIWTAVQSELGKAIMDDDSLRAVDRDRLAAEALGRLVAGGHAAARPNRADVVVLTDLDSLRHGLHDSGTCELSDSSILPAETIRRLACDGNIIPAVLDGEGNVLDLGRRRRLASPAQRRALRIMHDTCAFPGCDVPFDNCEIHHLLDWDHNGPTDLANLAPTCSRHHHLVHEGGWHARLNPDRTLDVWAPGETPPADAIPQPRAGPHHRDAQGDHCQHRDSTDHEREHDAGPDTDGRASPDRTDDRRRPDHQSRQQRRPSPDRPADPDPPFQRDQSAA